MCVNNLGHFKKSKFLRLPERSPLTVYGKAADKLLSCPTILKLQRPDRTSHET